MKTYVGTKIIRAEEMDECAFLKAEKNEDVLNRETQPGYKVIYPDGYVSWSPKAVFEEAYRLVSADEKILMSDPDTNTDAEVEVELENMERKG